jgi:hypothetical protein
VIKSDHGISSRIEAEVREALGLPPATPEESAAGATAGSSKKAGSKD